MLMATGVMAGIILSAMAAQAATTGDVKDTKSRLLKPGAEKKQTIKADQNIRLRRAAVKSWKDSTPRWQMRTGKRYLGGYRAWYGDSRYFGSKALKKGYGAGRCPTYTNRYYRPSEARAITAQRDLRTRRGFGYGYSGGFTPQCRTQSGYHRCQCCCGR